MVDTRLVIGHDKMTKQVSLNSEQSIKLKGKKIGDVVKGDDFGFPGYEFVIRGGTDKDGFPMKAGLGGTVRKKLLLSVGPGYKPKEAGIRKRKMVRGQVIDEDIAQVNVKVKKAGTKKLEELIGSTEEKKSE
ncbi:MAG: 30S ribosomal protein S6e [Candidatus Altiarchaeota archaeon]|nr:30S ribosomal protein S6e [Candidatus Altiarchaeota archaeon]